jgi:hypothetical protein
VCVFMSCRDPAAGVSCVVTSGRPATCILNYIYYSTCLAPSSLYAVVIYVRSNQTWKNHTG